MTSPEIELYERLTGGSATKPTAPSKGSVVEKEMERHIDTGKPVSIRNLFTHHDSHPIVLDLALLKAFGLEWLTWEAETLWIEIHRLFKNNVSELARTKIQSVRTLHLSPLPWSSWNVFEKIIQGLNNNIPRWDLMQAPTLEQLYAGIDMMDHIRHADFSDEVKLYMAASVLHEEVLFVPPPLDFIQAEVSQPYWRCLDCGNEDGALFHDGVCDTCTRKFQPEAGLSLRPDPEALYEGRGRNLELVLRFNPDDVEKRWNEIKGKATNDVDLEENEVDTQIAKLLVARDYMNVRRRQLAEQLTNLKSWLGAG